MISTSAAPAASAPPAGSPAQSARTGAAGHGRSFAATLAHERPSAHGEPASGDAQPATAESQSEASAQRQSGPAAKGAKARAKPAPGPNAAAGGGPSPADGNALPLWLPPTVLASAPLASIAVTPEPAPDGTPQVSATDLPQAAARASDRPAVGLALLAPDQAPDAAPPVEAVAPGAAATTPNPSPLATADATPAKAALATTATALERLRTDSPGSRATDDVSRRLAAAADAAPVAATPPPAPVAATAQPATAVALALAAAVAPATAAPAPKVARPAVTSGDARSPAATAADPAATLAPVAPDLEHAVAAALSASSKSDVVGTTAAVKVSVDATAGVLPQSSGAVPEQAASATVAQVATPVGAPGWTRELADRVSVLVNQNLTHAQIKLSPADLGPIEVRIALSDGQANVSFTTHSHLTSEALQAAAPRLREALSSQGYSSVNVDVAQQHFRERAPQQARYEPEPEFAAAAPQGAGRAAVRAAGVGGAERLDAYA